MSNAKGKDFWRRQVQRCIQSEATQTAYCRHHGLIIHQFGTGTASYEVNLHPTGCRSS